MQTETTLLSLSMIKITTVWERTAPLQKHLAVRMAVHQKQL